MNELQDLEAQCLGIVGSTTPLVDSMTIGYIAAKRNFSVERVLKLMEKAKMTKCACRHFTMTTPCCYYRNCRHDQQSHPLQYD
jgi:hypothetical protein